VFVGVYFQRLPFALGNLDRYDLVAEAPFLDGAERTALALKGKGILRLACDFAAGDVAGTAHLVDVLGRFAHRLQGKERFHRLVRVAPAEGGVVAGDVTGWAEGTGVLGERVWRAGHALDAAGDENIPFADGDCARSLINGVETAGTEPVDGDAGNVNGQPGKQHRHTGHVAIILAGLVGAAHVHLFDGVRIDVGAAYGFLDHQGSHVIGPHLG
jgi:hypothetical protein